VDHQETLETRISNAKIKSAGMMLNENEACRPLLEHAADRAFFHGWSSKTYREIYVS
jgi:hypothetical protein